MIVQVKLFAGARQTGGCDVVDLVLPEGATVGELRQQLARQCVGLAEMLPSLMFAVNQEYASDTAVIPEKAEVACIPPVSGG